MTTTTDAVTLVPEATRINNGGLTTYSNLYRGLVQAFGTDRLYKIERALDYGTGFGRGLGQMAAHHPVVDAYDPYPVEEWLHPQTLYTDRTALREGSYDLITVVYVLNVLPPDERREVVRDVWRLLAPGGTAAFVVRSWHTDVVTTKTGQPAAERHALLVPHGEGRYAYQKGYDHLDLVQELDWYLGDERVLSHPLRSWGPLAGYVTKEKTDER